MHDLPSDSWCPAPWMHLAMRYDGRLGVCAFGPTIDSTDGDHIDLAQLQAIKDAMLQGQRLNACDKCWFQERHGQLSRRQELLKQCADKVTFDSLTKSADVHRFSFDLSLGNRCNQRCRICQPSNSTAWTKDAAALEDLPWSHVAGPRTVRTAIGQLPLLIDLMSHSALPLELEIKGGEPLYMPEVRLLLDSMIKQGLHERTACLKLMTNGTVTDDSILSLIAQFPRVVLSLSIDAVGRLYEYTRSGNVSWDQARRGWDRLTMLSNVSELMISNTIYIYNAFDQSNLARWVHEAFGPQTNMANAFLQRPLYLNLKIMPDDLIEHACDLLTHHPDQSRVPSLKAMLQSELHEDDIRPNHTGNRHFSAKEAWQRIYRLRCKFKDYTNRLDALRAESCVDVVPQLRSMLV